MIVASREPRVQTASILVVDDEAPVRRLLCQMLEEEGGSRVTQAQGPAQARDALLRRDVDVVVSDLRMPGESGLDLFQWARDHAIDSAWIFLTAYGTFEDAVQAVRLGAFEFLTKPLSPPDSLRIAVRNALRQRELERQQQRLREELARANERAVHAEELNEYSRELSYFAHVASHDLQEPLRTVEGCVNLLRHRLGESTDAEAHELMEAALSGTTHMQEMLEALMDYARTGSRQAPFAEVQCQEAFRQAVSNLQATIDQTGARVTSDLLPCITGDRIQIIELLQNLIANAVRYNDEAVPTVHVSAGRVDQGWVLSVADNGVGIESSRADGVFRAFQTRRQSEQYGKAGIGLSLCRAIVRRHGGKIWFEPNGARGTVFRVWLPDRMGVEAPLEEAAGRLR